AHFVLAKILTIAIFIGAGILLALFLAITSFVSNLLVHNFPDIYKFVTLYKGNILFSTVIPVVLIFFSYVVITYLLVPVKVGVENISKAGVFFTFFFMLAKIFYGYYLKNITKMTLFYGGISALVVLILWVFYITTLYLISLEIIKNMRGRKETS
ncbi:MAG: YhjD/YihY/BrkB family envelope integrity protein, partial [Myxococcota bacterium]